MRGLRKARQALTLQHGYFKDIIDDHSRTQVILPMMEKTSMFFNCRALTRNFCYLMFKIQDCMRGIMQTNRAKMNYLQIIWDDHVEKLIFSYI